MRQTAKQKAEELFIKMDMIIYTDQDNGDSQCIRCALVAVVEILNVISTGTDFDEYEYDFWQEVKQELEKLKSKIK
jgi:hypothetical protein